MAEGVEGNNPGLELKVTKLPPAVPEGAATSTGKLPMSPDGQPLILAPVIQKKGVDPLFSQQLPGASNTRNAPIPGSQNTTTEGRHTTPDTAHNSDD